MEGNINGLPHLGGTEGGFGLFEWVKTVGKAFDKAVKHIWGKKEYNTEMLLTDKPVQNLRDELNECLKTAQLKGLADGVIPDAMRKSLNENLFVFSSCKTEKALRDVSALLTNENGKVRSFADFKKAIDATKRTYVEHYLEAEYIYATSASRAAARWASFESTKDDYDLQYRTAGDTKVRDAHKVLNRTTLPHAATFWDKYFPPNGWRCRCTVVQVKKGKYPLSDNAAALKLGDAATDDGKEPNRMAMFRYNPGKQGVIFPPHHPYMQVLDAKQQAEVLKQLPEEPEK